jgi:hypothetical protein
LKERNQRSNTTATLGRSHGGSQLGNLAPRFRCSISRSGRTADLLTRLGMKVDYAAVDFGTVVAHRAPKSPPAQGA